MDHFKNFYWICYNIVSILCFGGGFWPQGMWDLSSLTRDPMQPMQWPTTHAMEGEVLTTGPPEKSPFCRIFRNPGLNLCSPELAGRFLSPVPLGKSSDFSSFYKIIADPQNFCFCEFYLIAIYQLGMKTEIFIKMYDNLFLINSLCISVKIKYF